MACQREAQKTKDKSRGVQQREVRWPPGVRSSKEQDQVESESGGVPQKNEEGREKAITAWRRVMKKNAGPAEKEGDWRQRDTRGHKRKNRPIRHEEKTRRAPQGGKQHVARQGESGDATNDRAMRVDQQAQLESTTQWRTQAGA